MVCIIGDKYGFRPVPVTIDKNIFEMLLGSVKSNPGGKRAAELLVQWYKLDENSIPTAYILQPVSTFYPLAYKHHANDADEKKGKEERQQWWQTLETMTEALRKAASQIDFTAFPLSEMTEEDFKISVTETEITTGMNGEGVDPKYMILFIRSLKELHEMDLNNNKFTKRFVILAKLHIIDSPRKSGFKEVISMAKSFESQAEEDEKKKNGILLFSPQQITARK